MVLIVEDNEACADTLEIALERVSGVQVIKAADGLEALSILEALPGPVSAVITDLQLPHMDGLDLLARLRSDARFLAVPIIVITGESDPSAPERARSAGANAFFTKPYSPSEVRKRVEQLIG